MRNAVFKGGGTEEESPQSEGKETRSIQCYDKSESTSRWRVESEVPNDAERQRQKSDIVFCGVDNSWDLNENISSGIVKTEISLKSVEEG